MFFHCHFEIRLSIIDPNNGKNQLPSMTLSMLPPTKAKIKYWLSTVLNKKMLTMKVRAMRMR